VAIARGKKGVDVAGGDVSLHRPDDDVGLVVGEQPGNPADPEAAGDHAVGGDAVRGGRDRSGLEARLAAGLRQEPFDGRQDPILLGELRQLQRSGPGSQSVVGRKADQEGVAEEVDPLGALDLTSLDRRE
jgi:hypothetical protein